MASQRSLKFQRFQHNMAGFVRNIVDRNKSPEQRIYECLLRHKDVMDAAHAAMQGKIEELTEGIGEHVFKQILSTQHEASVGAPSWLHNMLLDEDSARFLGYDEQTTGYDAIQKIFAQGSVVPPEGVSAYDYISTLGKVMRNGQLYFRNIHFFQGEISGAFEAWADKYQDYMPADEIDRLRGVLKHFLEGSWEHNIALAWAESDLAQVKNALSMRLPSTMEIKSGIPF